MIADTIAAISTPPGEGAIALIRLSGPEAVAIGGRVFRGVKVVTELEARRQYFGVIEDAGRKIDEVLFSLRRAPASYTGEDVVEIACHGGVLITRRILELVLRAGARAAQPGEFTQRAFLHGKMDLTQAEAVMDLISAQTDLALRAAQEQLEGRLGERMRALREKLLELLAHLEAFIDFPDEDIDPDSGAALEARMAEIRAALVELLGTAQRGRWLRQGVRTVIYGAPNVGKSSLLNLLLGYERAIVSPVPGTTRDTIEETIDLRGIPLRLIDTAGVRTSEDPVERAGIERTLRQVERADLVLHLYDASAPRPPAEESARPALAILNKIDLGEHPDWRGQPGVRLSCLEPRGVDDLEAAIKSEVMRGERATREWSLAINARHQRCLEEALAFLEAGATAMGEGVSAEFVAEELRGALGAIGEVVGRVETDELLGKIFSTFCIGK
jgi:tRNA modification GTPase